MNPVVKEALDRVNQYIQEIDWDKVHNDRTSDIEVQKDIAKAIRSVEFLKSVLKMFSQDS